MMGRLLAVGITVAALLPAGCSAPPPPPPPTVVNLTITTSADVNPDASGNPQPIAIRVYQLASPANFSGAEFFPLFNADAATLKTDLVHRDDFLLPPGQTKTATLHPDAPVKSLGVFAAYRNFQQATWRGTAEVPANKTTNVTVTAGRDGVTVKSEPAPPPKPAS